MMPDGSTMKPVPTACALGCTRCWRWPCWPKRSANWRMNSSSCCWVPRSEPRSDICVSSSSEAPAFMVTCTFTTAGVTLAASSEKSCGIASPAMAGGAVKTGTISAGAVSAVVSARAARIRDLVLVIGVSLLFARGRIWAVVRGVPMAARLNVCIVGPVKILLVEDDRQTADYIAKGLREHGHVVDKTDNGRDGLYMATGEPYDVMIVDRNLPKMDGLSLVKAARGSGTRTPVLFLTSMGGVDDMVAGLEAGADDYLVKPFAFAELLARVSALARRPPLVAATSLRVGDLEVDLLARTVTRAGKRIELLAQEFKILEYLMRHAGEIVTRTMLLEKVWDFHFDPKTNIVETHISRLRSKIDRGFDKPLLHTVRGAGYVIRPAD